MRDSFCKGYIKVLNLPSDFNGSGQLDVEVANHSDQNWEAEGAKRVKICYHWIDENWNMVIYDGIRTELTPSGIASGTSAVFSAKIKSPEKPGSYYLMLTMVRDGMYWFDDAKGFHMQTIKIQVKPNTSQDSDLGRTVPASSKTPDSRPDPKDSSRILNTGVLLDQSYLLEIKPYERGRKFAFMHIPKTSGSAMRDFLVKAMQLETYFHAEKAGQEKFNSEARPEFFGHANYFGHIAHENLLKYCPDGQYLTVFREATSRILSTWLFWRQASSNLDEESLKSNNHLLQARGRLVDILREPSLARDFDNMSLRMLVWPHKKVPDSGFIDKKDDEELIQFALARLQKYSYFDVMENPHFEKNLQDWLCTNLNLDHVNVTQNMPGNLRVPLHREFTPEALDVLDERSRLDRILWASVAAARMPGVDLGRLTRDSLIKSIARYSDMMS